METSRTFRIVVAYPSDVQAERNSLDGVVAEVNWTHAIHDFKIILTLSSWETDVQPGLHRGGTQALIESVLKIPECDILIGICWKRFGRPYKDGSSNTEHEIDLAYESWQRTGKPDIMLFFNETPYPPKSSAETDEWGKVLNLKAKYADRGIYGTFEYDQEIRFSDVARKALLSFGAKMEHGISVEAMADPRVLRAEGLAELPGEVRLSITVGALFRTQTVDIYVTAGAIRITSQIRNGLCETTLVFEGSKRPSVRGRLINSNNLLFEDVEILQNSDPLQCRITNLRLVANQVGISSNPPSTPIWEMVSIYKHGITSDLLFQKSVRIATVQRALLFRVKHLGDLPGPFRVSQSLGINERLISGSVWTT